MYLPSAAQMKKIDADAISSGIPSTLLMENAAKALCEAACAMLETEKTAAVFSGPGNNGGDGFAVAGLLLRRGVDVKLFLVGDRLKMTPDTLEMERRLLEIGGEIYAFAGNEDKAAGYLKDCGLIIDAMLGIGLTNDICGDFKTAVEMINNCGKKILAADIPSGVHADSGKILGSAVKAAKTVTFTLPKKACYLLPVCLNFGELEVADIGIPADFIEKHEIADGAVLDNFVDKLLKRRPRDSHKGDYGKVLMLCGSEGYTGAAHMAAAAAVRTGSGLVSLGVPKSIYPIIAAKCTEAMPFPLADDGNGKLSASCLGAVMDKLDGCDVCLIGPGLGRSGDISEIVSELVRKCPVPLVIDADGINAVSENINILRAKKSPVVLTPHDGEFMRLTGKPVNDRLAEVKDFSSHSGCVTVLKGYRTVTASPAGSALINTTGNPGMAKGGSGDVLAGILASLIGQGLEPYNAAAAAVFLHGKAGDICAEELGEYGMTPADMLDTIPRVMKKYDYME